MKVLFITNEIPFYTGGGMPIRDFNLLKNLSDRYQFTIVCFEDTDVAQQQQRLSILEAFCDKVYTVPRPEVGNGLFRHSLNKIERYLHPQSWFVRQLLPRCFQEQIQHILSRNQFGIVHVNHVEMGSLLYQVRDAKRLIGIEMLSPKIERLGHLQAKAKGRLFYTIEKNKVDRYERKLFEKADLCTMVSQVEADMVKETSPRARVWIIPNGVDCNYVNFEEKRCSTDDPLALLFVGSMGYPPNEDAVVYFQREIWPLICETVSNVEVYLVGRDPSSLIRNLESPDFKILGWVDDIRPTLHKSQIMVVPLRSGGGTRLKILDAMSAGLPVVSTSVGAEGLDVTHMKDILIADNPIDFAQAIKTLFNDPNLARSISVNGRKLVETKYDWKTISAELDRAYQSLFQL